MQKLDGLLKETNNLDSAGMELRIRQAKDYMEMAQLYKSAIREITTKLEVLDSEFSVRYDHNPIHHIDNRLKSIASIVEKLRRKGAAVSIENAKAYLTDIAGVRVVCNYIDDIYRIADMLCAQDDIVVLRRTDYIENPKENGYRSLHVIVEVPIFLKDIKKPMKVEIQFRTIAMDFWASLEHQIHYKASREVPDCVVDELKECADIIAHTDERMQSLSKQIRCIRDTHEK